jgi:hypothetical protein
MSLFLRLSEHLPREEENYLTQCLAAVFEGSKAFRRRFASILVDRRVLPSGMSPESLCVQTQIARLGRRRSILDFLILSGRRELAAIEIKFAAGINNSQLERHAANIGSRCQLVLLTRASDCDLPDRLRSQVRVLSWGDVCRCGKAVLDDGRTPEDQRWLVEEFMAFLKAKHIVSADPVPIVDWPRIVRVAAMWGGRERRSAGSFSVALTSLSSLVSRLEWHRNESWSELDDAGWRPYTTLWRYEPNEGGKLQNVSILAGYYKSPRLKSVRRSVFAVNFGIELALCSDSKKRPPPQLSIWSYRSLRRAARDDGRTERTHSREYGKSFSRKVVQDLFQRDWEDAHASISDWMRGGLAQFKRSVGWQEVQG